jgi:hypothetical protein
MRLSFGLKTEDKEHSISKLRIGDNSRNSLVLQPGEILFLEISMSLPVTQITFDNTVILKVCSFTQENPPSVQDVEKAGRCLVERNSQTFWLIKEQNASLKEYITVENQQQTTAKLTITTSSEALECSLVQLG